MKNRMVAAVVTLVVGAGSLGACGTTSSYACGVLEADGDDYVQVDPGACSTPGNAPWGPMLVDPSEIDSDGNGGYGVYAGRRYDSHRYDKKYAASAPKNYRPAARPVVNTKPDPAKSKPRSSWFSSAKSSSTPSKAPSSSSKASTSSSGSKSSSKGR